MAHQVEVEEEEGDSGVIGRLRNRIRTDHVLRERIHKGVAIITLGVVLVWLLLPIFWAIQTALKPRVVAQSYPPVFWGFDIAWENFNTVLTSESLIPFIRNGVIVASFATLLSLTLGVPHAYAISKYSNRFTNASLFTILAARIIPPISIAVPFYILFQEIGLIDSRIAVVIVLTFLFEPFVVWIMKGFFDGLPSSLIDAARVDGCSKFQAFYKIMLPLALPGLGSAIIITWLLGWNHFVLVFIITSTEAAQTVPIGVLNLSRDHYVPWNLISAAAVIAMIPSVVVVVAFQRYLMRGLAERRT